MNLPEPAATAGSEWRSLSACRDSDPELFFPLSAWGPSLTQLASAKAICGRCQVSADCLRFALTSGQEYGVWGGTSEDERRAMRRAEHVMGPMRREHRPTEQRGTRQSRVRSAAGQAAVPAPASLPTVLR